MMNQEDLLKKTGNILKELQEQFDYLAQDPKKLSELELELFLANAHFLTEHVQILKKVATTAVVHALPEHTEVNLKEIQPQAPVNVYDELFKPDIETPTFEFIVHDQLKETATPLMEKPVADQFEDIESKEQEHIIADQDQQIIQQSSSIEQPFEGTVPVASRNPDDIDNYTNQQPSAFEPLEEISFPEVESQSLTEPDEDEIGPEPFLVIKEEAPVPKAESIPLHAEEPATPIKHQPNLNEMLASKSSVVNINLSESGKPMITDLKSAINLNEKLLFIKDLFDGYNLAYAEAIDLVNKMADFSSADKFLQANYAAKHQWSSKPSTVEQLYELLHQRFPK